MKGNYQKLDHSDKQLAIERVIKYLTTGDPEEPGVIDTVFKHGLFMPSTDAADINMMLSRGWLKPGASRIVCCENGKDIRERDKEAWQKKLLEDGISMVMPKSDISCRWCDIEKIIRSKREKPYDFVHLDFCGEVEQSFYDLIHDHMKNILVDGAYVLLTERINNRNMSLKAKRLENNGISIQAENRKNMDGVVDSVTSTDTSSFAPIELLPGTDKIALSILENLSTRSPLNKLMAALLGSQNDDWRQTRPYAVVYRSNGSTMVVVGIRYKADNSELDLLHSMNDSHRYDRRTLTKKDKELMESVWGPDGMRQRMENVGKPIDRHQPNVNEMRYPIGFYPDVARTIKKIEKDSLNFNSIANKFASRLLKKIEKDTSKRRLSTDRINVDFVKHTFSKYMPSYLNERTRSIRSSRLHYEFCKELYNKFLVGHYATCKCRNGYNLTFFFNENCHISTPDFHEDPADPNVHWIDITKQGMADKLKKFIESQGEVELKEQPLF